MSTAPAAPLVQTFMTHRMSDASIEMLATGREVETQRIMDAVERSLRAAPGALQHMVIYGPRGFGKSFIARLVQIETGKLAAARSLPVPFVLLPEEQHNLTRNPHALPADITHRLADTWMNPLLSYLFFGALAVLVLLYRRPPRPVFPQ